ncbi:uncharacterized protein BP5553_03815 [Venustampulla echinocandica]|uniref:Cation/H+ exchanger domain-containing protein n=1 Tax=Venustampulla echinocandica TaxID=2656787 RepID=A0A370TVA8_9HELO|nr:uncharacterized protein BP5553_03815 [Venustampulla echinocandica]RDL39475.1 hypothetical protein BP5553_03815 [Venustampulla echinocandica]
MGVDDLLVGFAAGVGFSNDGWFTQKTEESHVSNVIDLLLNLAYFVYLGTIIPWEQYNNAALGLTPWRLVVIAIFVIFFRRIPIMMALKPLIPDVKTWREALFAGHFGPIGVGAIFVAILARAELETETTTPLAEYPDPSAKNYTLVALIWPITTFLVITSIIVHGSSIAVFTLGKHINTLTLTMSYTAAGPDGPTWMNRLPRISSTSRSQAKSFGSETEAEEIKMNDIPPGTLPPGTLPPIGIPGSFLRRQKEEDNPSRAGSRTSSIIPRRRKKKWDDGRGPGGPISESAIYPQHRSQNEPLSDQTKDEQTSDTLTPSEGSPHNEKVDTQIQSEAELRDAEHDPEVTHQHSEGERKAFRKSDANISPTRREAFQEGDDIIIEDADGNVLSVQKVSDALQKGESIKRSEHAAKEDSGLPTQGYKNLRKKLGVWARRDEGNAEGSSQPKSAKQPHKKHGPALAYQFGNTIIVEDEDGEVVKKYDLPSSKQPKEGESSKAWQGVNRMGAWTGFGTKKPDSTAETGKDGAPPPTSAVRQGLNRMGTWGAKRPEVDDEDDDRHIRFKIGGAGRRLTKEDFLNEIRSLDPKARAEIVRESDAPAPMKERADKDADEDSPGSSRLFMAGGSSSASKARAAEPLRPEAVRRRPGLDEESDDDDRSPTNRRPIRTGEATSSSSSPSSSLDDVPESAAERRRRQEALKGVDEVTPTQRGRSEKRSEYAPEIQESAAEKRRREAALGMGDNEDDSDDDDTPRVPPPVAKSRGIRFAQSPVRAKK